MQVAVAAARERAILNAIVCVVCFGVVALPARVDGPVAAELAGVNVDTVYAYNPGYNRWATDPKGPHQLVMPIAVADVFTDALATVPANERVRWKRHLVKNGDTVS